MMIDCSKCRYFYGYDGVGELWTGCSIHGDFKGTKTNCKSFEKKVTKVDLLKKIHSLEKENEQLRKTMNEVIELLVEEVDLFSDKATEHDIIAYKEMNDFDNKDAYYMCISTKKAIKMLQRCF